MSEPQPSVTVVTQTASVLVNSETRVVVLGAATVVQATAVGTQGPAGAKGVAWRGDWADDTAYWIGDLVTITGSVFICVQDHRSTANPPTLHGDSHWVVIEPPLPEVVRVTSDYTVALTDSVVLVDASARDVTITLPLADPAEDRRYAVKRLDTSSHFVRLDGVGTEAIDGEETFDLLRDGESVTVVSDGSNWSVI